MEELAEDALPMLERIEQALHATAALLEGQPGPALVERPVEDALAATLGATRQYRVQLAGWHGRLGPVDVALPAADGTADAMIEVKSGGHALYNCAWDVAKLAVCVGERQTQVAMIVAAAAAEDWAARPSGAELFDAMEWRLDVFLARFQSAFARWRVEVDTRPKALPWAWRISPLAPIDFRLDGRPWQLRAAAVTEPDDAAMPVDFAPTIAAWKRGVAVPPSSGPGLPRAPDHVPPPTDGSTSVEVQQSELEGAQVFAAEGGSVSAVERFGLLSDESAIADILGPDEDLEWRRVTWFRSAAERRRHLDARGWRPEASPLPEVLHVSAGSGLGSSFETSWNGREIMHTRSGRDVASENASASFRPRDVAWRAFWRRLDELDVWSWRYRYVPISMSTDGYDWRVRISVGGRSCDSSGYMTFPGGDGDSTHDWDSFLLALSDLLGAPLLGVTD